MVCAYGGGKARMRIWGKGVCSDVACRVAILSVPRRDTKHAASSIAFCCRKSHFYQLASAVIAILVGEAPSNASALPLASTYPSPQPYCVSPRSTESRTTLSRHLKQLAGTGGSS